MYGMCLQQDVLRKTHFFLALAHKFAYPGG